MSSKAVESNVKKLVALGYSKSKSQKAMKECGNNFTQAKTWLERTKEEEDRKAHEAELAAKALANAEKKKKEEVERKERESTLPPEPDFTPDTRKHPCIAQYGNCRYGAACMYKELPWDTCINYLKGDCMYADMCRNRHAINGVDIRKLMMPDRDLEHEFIRMENGDYVQISRHGKVVDGEVWVSEFPDEVIPAPLPEPSAFAGDSGSMPTYSEPVAQHQHHQQHGGAAGGGSGMMQQASEDIWGTQLSPGSFVPTGGDASSSGVVGFTLNANAHTPGSPSAPTPFLAKARIGQHVAQPVQPKPLAPVPRVEPQQGPATQAHPCIVQMGDCRFGPNCNYADVRGDVCVHWLNGRCRNAPDECRFYHEFIVAGAQPKNPRAGVGAGGSGSSRPSPSMGGMSLSTPPTTPGGHSSGAYAAGGAQQQHQQPDPSIWGNPTPFGGRNGATGAAGAPVPGQQRPGGDEWTKSFEPPSQEESGFRAGDEFVARMHADVALHETNAPAAPAGTGKWQGPPSSLLKAPTSKTAPAPPQMDTSEEARAFEALLEVFPHVEPGTILQALRKCGFDRQLVAQAIADCNPETVEKQLQSVMDENMAASKSVVLVTLHSLLPSMEPASLERILADCNGDFDEAYTRAACTVEHLVSSDPTNQWGGKVKDAQTGRQTTFTPAEQMKLERLQGMYRELERFVIENAFERAKRNTTDAVAILNHLNSDLKIVARETREEWGHAATTKLIGTAAKEQRQQQRRSEAASKPKAAPAASADDFSFTVSCGDDAQAEEEKKPLSSLELYKETKEEAADHSDWRRTRQEAYMVNSARIRMVGLAVQAYARQQHDVGKNLLRKSQELRRQYERLNMLAMHALERERNAQHGVSVIDLHGFHVDEAQDFLARRIEQCARRRVGKLRVVVGHGNHSRAGRSVIYPRVLEQLRAHPQCMVKSILPAEIVVNIDLTH